MPNTKPVGVAFSDPELVSGTTITGAAVSGGTVDNAVIGGVTPAAGTFTTVTSTSSTGVVAANANAGVYILSTAITANSTTTSAPVGSLGITTNATGKGKLFYADGTKWQFMAIT